MTAAYGSLRAIRVAKTHKLFNKVDKSVFSR
jgi:hypothetical protein